MIIDLKNIAGVGPKLLKQFRDQGIWNTYDLVSYLPKKYDNFSVVDVDSLKHEEVSTVIGTIYAPLFTVKKKVVWTTTSILVQDKLIKLNIFGRDYLTKVFKKDDVVLVKGKYNIFKNEMRSEEHTSELQSRPHLVCRLLLEKKK